MTVKRELQLAVLLCLLGSAVILFALGRPWFSVETAHRITIQAVRASVAGDKVASGAQALGYVGLAGVVALAATKRWGRVLVGVLVLASGVGVIVSVCRVLADGVQRRALATLGPGEFTAPSTTSGWAWLVLVGGVLLIGSGLLVAVRGRRWAALSSAYEAPSSRAPEPPATDKGVWDALDRGEDPTSSL